MSLRPLDGGCGQRDGPLAPPAPQWRMPRQPLPDGLTARPFTRREGISAGLGRGRLLGPDLSRPAHGLRSATPVESLPQRVAALAVALPDDVAFSHITSAALWGLPLPRTVEVQNDLDVIRRTDRGRIRRAGCLGHKGLESRATHHLHGVRVVDLADTWCDLGEVLARGLCVDDLVVVADEVARRLSRGVRQIPAAAGTAPSTAPRRSGVDALAATLAQRRRPRGKACLAEALLLTRDGSRSPMETRARLMFVRAGFPEPELNAPVRDADGGWLLEGDLVWRTERVVAEYQGEVHASISRRGSDAQRRALATDAGWTVLEVFNEDVVRRARRVDCLTRFARSLGLDPGTLRIH